MVKVQKNSGFHVAFPNVSQLPCYELPYGRVPAAKKVREICGQTLGGTEFCKQLFKGPCKYILTQLNPELTKVLADTLIEIL